jgi:hypothetical protein
MKHLCLQTNINCRKNRETSLKLTALSYRLQWSRGSVLAFPHPAEAVGYLERKKFLITPSFGRKAKSWIPCRSFTACKRSLNVTCKSAFRQKLPGHFSPTVLSSAVGCSRVVTRVETTGGESWNV